MPKSSVKEFFSMKMAWLSQLCRDPFVTDRQFRVAYSLAVNFLGNESLWCCPSDKVLGESVAKSTRTVGEITRELERDGYLIKHRRRGSSQYEFPDLAVNFGTSPSEVGRDATVTLADSRADFGGSTSELRNPVCRTEPSYLEPPYLEPSYCSEEEIKKGIQGGVVEVPSTNANRPAEPQVTITMKGHSYVFWTGIREKALEDLEVEIDPQRRQDLIEKIARAETKLKDVAA
jgi:hypothetical protein